MDFDKNIKQLKWEIINFGFEVCKFIHQKACHNLKILLQEWLFWF